MTQIYEEGVLPQNLEKSVEYDPTLSQCLLGAHYLNGRGLFPKDKQQALHWFTLAANQGNVAAMLNVGRIYLDCYVAHSTKPQALHPSNGLTAQAFKWFSAGA